MTTPTRRHGFRAASAIILLLGGVGVAIATWVGGSHGWAIAAIVAYAVIAAGAYVWAGHPATSLHCCAVAATNGNAD